MAGFSVTNQIFGMFVNAQPFHPPDVFLQAFVTTSLLVYLIHLYQVLWVWLGSPSLLQVLHLFGKLWPQEVLGTSL